ncbi:hypothetical protein FIBSPDRAFT_877730, partial [Athelia psychrophila]
MTVPLGLERGFPPGLRWIVVRVLCISQCCSLWREIAVRPEPDARDQPLSHDHTG